jgi:hypothetical protein
MESALGKSRRKTIMLFLKIENQRKRLTQFYVFHLLYKIVINVTHLPKGIHGLGPRPYILKPIVRYRLNITRGNRKCTINLTNPIAIPENQAFSFETEITERDQNNRGIIYPLHGRIVTGWEFHFSNAQIVRIPTIHFNCLDDSPAIQIIVLG